MCYVRNVAIKFTIFHKKHNVQMKMCCQFLQHFILQLYMSLQLYVIHSRYIPVLQNVLTRRAQENIANFPLVIIFVLVLCQISFFTCLFLCNRPFFMDFLSNQLALLLMLRINCQPSVPNMDPLSCIQKRPLHVLAYVIIVTRMAYHLLPVFRCCTLLNLEMQILKQSGEGWC